MSKAWIELPVGVIEAAAKAGTKKVSVIIKGQRPVDEARLTIKGTDIKVVLEARKRGASIWVRLELDASGNPTATAPKLRIRDSVE